ncbi:MAG: hypothetical protein JNM09_27635 [Blastocatellia bacterium]|nr:hypothetical protein [Blastocatellia bacterium]
MKTTTLEANNLSLSLRDIAAVMFRRWRLMLFIFAAIIAIAVAFAILPPNKYESRMKLLVRNARVDAPVTPERTNGPSDSAPAEITEADINSEIQLLLSRDLLQQIVREHDLMQAERSRFNQADSAATLEEKAVRRLEKALVVAPIKKSNLIEVSYTASTPERAHAVLQRVAALYQEKHLQVHRPPGTHEFFATQVTQYEDQLRAAEAALSRHQQKLNVVSLEQEKELNLRKMLEARATLLATETALNEATKRIEATARELTKQPPRIVTLNRVLPYQQSVERLSTMLVELQNRRTQLLTRFQPTDRLVQELEQQIKDTSIALDNARQHTAVEQSSDLNPVRQNLIAELEKAKLEQAGLQAKRATLAQQVRQYEALLAKLDNGTNAYSELARQVKTLAENYQLYTRKRDEALLADALDQRKITNVSLAEAPTQSSLPSSPDRLLNLALGVFLASFFSVASAVSAELFRDTVLTARELEALTGQPVLATVPHQRLERKTQQHNAHTVREGEDLRDFAEVKI